MPAEVTAGEIVKLLLGFPLWLLVALVRVVLWVIGWFAVALSLVGDGAKRTPKMWQMWADAANTPAAYATSIWKKYVWWAWRNPTPGWIGKWKQPIPEVRPNPDSIVRDDNWVGNGTSRWMQHGYYWEYWYLRRISIGKYRFFEFRIGWKFVDGNEEFFPTLQFGPRSS